MSVAYAVPGVYIEERNALSLDIHGGDTAVPVFVGHFRAKAPAAANAWDGQCVRVESWLDFTTRFGASDEAHVTIADNKKPPTNPDWAKAAHTSHVGSYSVRIYFENGGGPCYVLPLSAFSATALANATAQIEAHPEISLLCWCEHREKEDDLVYTALATLLGASADSGGNRGYFLLTDAVYDWSKGGLTPALKSPSVGKDSAQAAAYFPALQTDYRYAPDDEAVVVTSGLSTGIWGNDSLKLAEMRAATDNAIGTKNHELMTAQCAAVRAAVATAALEDQPLYLRASVAMAGVYARTDRERGVWKAPANVALAGVSGLAAFDAKNKLGLVRVDDTLNEKLADAGINAIRAFNGKGVLAWGARTLADSHELHWRYVPVRRLFNAVERDARAALRAAVFEPNSAPTWEAARSALDHYLHALWRDGALAGNTAEEAYFVRVGRGITMTDTQIAEGYLIVEVGLAAVRPAEFIVLRLSQQMAG